MEIHKTKKILLLVSGMSPQIITETLYALILENGWVPDTVHLITTEQGRDNAVLQLLKGQRHFYRLLSDYQITAPVDFTEDNVHLIQDTDGKPLSDLRTPQDNEAAADTITEVIRELTKENNTELHVSLAGGRKTMGFYAGYALSLYGRAQDRLSHVLVSEHYESNPEFFYPTPDTRVIHDRNGQPLDSSKAKVWLAEIPFVRLRNRLPETLLISSHSFSETVSLAREATESVSLTLHPCSGEYSVNSRKGKLSALHMTLLLWIVQKGPITPLVEGEKRDSKELLDIAEKYWLNLGDKTEESLKTGITKHWLEPNVSRLNKAVAKTVGVELGERCKLASRTSNGERGYSLPEELIVRIEE